MASTIEFPQLSKSILLVPIAALAVLFVYSGLYTVPAESMAVVLRFGKIKGEPVESGLRFKIPYGVDKAIIVPVKRQLKMEFGFGTRGGTNVRQFSNQNEWPLESTMVTGDLNSALVEWVLQYRIDDTQKFLFNVNEPELTLRDLSEAVMREVVGDRTVDEVLTIGRQSIEAEALSKMQVVSNLYGLGLTIDQVQLKNVNPPQPVQASFNEVNQAQQEKEKLINVADGEYYKVIEPAKGDAKKRISESEGYASQRVNEAMGDVARFSALLTEYVKAPEVTKRRIYLETMGEVLPRLRSKVIIDEGAKQILPLLQLEGGVR